MPPKRRAKPDPDVIKTRPDLRKATGKEEDDAWDNASDRETTYESAYTTITATRHKRVKTRRSTAPEPSEDPFPFFRLPAEIRNLIYRYLVVSKNEKISLNEAKAWVAGGIQINILLANRQTFNEASRMLYDENKYTAIWSRFDNGVAFRVDNPKTKTTTSRALRSGRTVDMVKHSGLIYEHIFENLRHVELRVKMLSRNGFCDHITLFWFKRFRNVLNGKLWALLHKRYDKRFDKTHHQGRNWALVIQSEGPQARQLLKKVLEPILCPDLGYAMKQGKLVVRLEGMFPQEWRRVFHRLNGKDGLITEKLKVGLDARDIPSFILEDYFDFDDDYF